MECGVFIYEILCAKGERDEILVFFHINIGVTEGV